LTPSAQLHIPCFLILSWIAGSLFQGAPAQHRFHQVTGQEFDYALPKDFYLEGKAFPTERRNAAMLRIPDGKRLLFALLDTSGYSSQSRQKYMGMIITETRISLCGNSIKIGSYGFGLTGESAPVSEESGFAVYDQAGDKVANCLAKKDLGLKQPKPLHIIESGRESVRLYLGRYWLELR
jgi:hypothetical protein